MLATRLAASVCMASEVGFVRVGLLSNAHAFGRPELATLLRTAGLTDLLVPLHGPTAACHDYHLKSAGAFVATRVGLDAARAAGLAVAISTAITRSSFRALHELGALLGQLGVSAWQLVIPTGLEPSSEAFVRLVPRFALAVPHALHAIEQARGRGIGARLRAAPLCRLGPYATVALPGRTLRFGRACQACLARAQCPGVDRGYLETYGEDELGALAKAPAPPAPLAPAEELLVEHDVLPV